MPGNGGHKTFIFPPLQGVPIIKQPQLVRPPSSRGQIDPVFSHPTCDLRLPETNPETQLQPNFSCNEYFNNLEAEVKIQLCDDLDNCTEPVYKCTECKFQTNLHTKYSSRNMLYHWVTKHHDLDPLSLEFTDTSTGQKLRVGDIYNFVARCSVTGCSQVFGSNGRRDSQLYHNVRTHWKKKHIEEEECEDKDKMEILIRRIETGVMECMMDDRGLGQ